MLTIYSNCEYVVRPYSFTSESGGIAGNPMAPVSSKVMLAVCGVINRCHLEVTSEVCLEGISGTTGFNSPLGLSSGYSSFSSILLAEQSGALVGNLTAGGNCYDSINALNCTDPPVQSAYNSSSANPFGNSPNMIPAASCHQVFAPGVNLEVPIELLDVGASSQTGPLTFSRSRTSLNTSDYDGVVSFSFEVITTNNSTATKNIYLVDSSGTALANVVVPPGTSVPTRMRVGFNPTIGANDYRIKLDGTINLDELNAYVARILVKQVGATQTKIYVPMTGGYAANAIDTDDSTAASDGSIYGTGIYNQNASYYFSLWKKNNSAFSQLAPANPYTFEAVLSTSTANSTTASASLFNYTTGNQIFASEVTTTSASPSLVSISFSDSAANFANLDDIEVRVKNSGANSGSWIYRSGIWIKLTNLTHAEVYYRYSKLIWLNSSHQLQYQWNMVLLDKSLFDSPMIYNEGSGYVTALTTPCMTDIFDIGLNDSGTTGSSTNSSIAFTQTKRLRQRSAPLILNSGHRFISETQDASAGPGSCIISDGRIVVRF